MPVYWVSKLRPFSRSENTFQDILSPDVSAVQVFPPFFSSLTNDGIIISIGKAFKSTSLVLTEITASLKMGRSRANYT